VTPVEDYNSTFAMLQTS